MQTIEQPQPNMFEWEDFPIDTLTGVPILDLGDASHKLVYDELKRVIETKQYREQIFLRDDYTPDPIDPTGDPYCPGMAISWAIAVAIPNYWNEIVDVFVPQYAQIEGEIALVGFEPSMKNVDATFKGVGPMTGKFNYSDENGQGRTMLLSPVAVLQAKHPNGKIELFFRLGNKSKLKPKGICLVAGRKFDVVA